MDLYKSNYKFNYCLRAVHDLPSPGDYRACPSGLHRQRHPCQAQGQMRPPPNPPHPHRNLELQGAPRAGL